MKNILAKLLFLIFTTFIIAASSCHKEEPISDLVPITTTSANTMGFYVVGIPYNKKGAKNFGNPGGVAWWKYNDNKIELAGGGGDPYGYIRFSFFKQPNSKNYLLNKLSSSTGSGEFIDDAPLGGNEYYTNDTVTGKLEILRFDDHIISGNFDIQLQDPITGKIVHLTDGRFDIKR